MVFRRVREIRTVVTPDNYRETVGVGVDGAGPGIILLEDERQIRSMKQMKKDFTATETEDGHGDGFISNMLAVYSCESGPRMKAIANMQEVFGGQQASRSRHNVFCKHEWATYQVDDPLGVREPVRYRRCSNCGE